MVCRLAAERGFASTSFLVASLGLGLGGLDFSDILGHPCHDFAIGDLDDDAEPVDMDDDQQAQQRHQAMAKQGEAADDLWRLPPAHTTPPLTRASGNLSGNPVEEAAAVLEPLTMVLTMRTEHRHRACHVMKAFVMMALLRTTAWTRLRTMLTWVSIQLHI